MLYTTKRQLPPAGMKTLILCVDRDDDLGNKGGVTTPVVGRRRCVDAALALGLADPEDSDTNALLAAVHLYDQELKGGAQGEQVEVACIAGHRSLGLKADRKLAAELESILAAVRPDGIILVSDGAEDEQIMPILQSHAKIVHVHRSIVKQAPRLEGFYYVITRLLDDEKQAKRFVLPFALVLLLWGVSYLLNLQNYAWGATLAVVGLWLTVHAMQWEEKVGDFFHAMGEGIRSGKLTLLATLAMVVILVAGAVFGLQNVQNHRASDHLVAPAWLSAYHVLLFTQAFLPLMVSALLVRTGGALFDAWVREKRAGAGLWAVVFLLISFGLIGIVAVDSAVDHLEAKPWLQIATLPRMGFLAAGLIVLVCFLIVSRYVRDVVAGPPRPERVR